MILFTALLYARFMTAGAQKHISQSAAQLSPPDSLMYIALKGGKKPQLQMYRFLTSTNRQTFISRLSD